MQNERLNYSATMPSVYLLSVIFTIIRWILLLLCFHGTIDPILLCLFLSGIIIYCFIISAIIGETHMQVEDDTSSNFIA